MKVKRLVQILMLMPDDAEVFIGGYSTPLEYVRIGSFDSVPVATPDIVLLDAKPGRREVLVPLQENVMNDLRDTGAMRGLSPELMAYIMILDGIHQLNGEKLKFGRISRLLSRVKGSVDWAMWGYGLLWATAIVLVAFAITEILKLLL